MPTAVDVLDRIKTERKAKFAQEIRPLTNYLKQMQEYDAQQRQRTEAKEDYVWQAEQTTKMAEERRIADNKRQGEVARLYYGGGKVEDMLASGDYSAKEIETAMSMGKSPDFSSALKDVEKGVIGLNAKELRTKYPNLPPDQADVIVGAKLDSNYNEVYRTVESSKDGDKQKVIVKAFKDGKLTADQYDKMTASVLSGSKAQADVNLANAKVNTELAKTGGGVGDFNSIIQSPEFKQAVSQGLGYEDKKRIATQYLNERGINPDANQRALYDSSLGLVEPSDDQKEIVFRGGDWKRQMIYGEDETTPITPSQAQDNYILLADAEIAVNGATSVINVEDVVSDGMVERIEEKRNSWKNKYKQALIKCGLNPEKPVARQYVDSSIINALLYDLDLAEDGE